MIMYVWIKVLYDEGIMHVKVKEVLDQSGRLRISLIRHETGKLALEPLSFV